MLLSLLLAGLATAGPDSPFPRAEEAVRVRRYVKVEGDGPVRGKWRKSTGPVEAWTFPDYTIEHYRLWEGRNLLEEHFFRADGQPSVTIVHGGGRPQQATVNLGTTQVELDLKAWTEHAVGGSVFLAPSEPDGEQDAQTWSLEGAQVRMQVVGGSSDVFGDDFRDGLTETCACVVEDRTTVWVQGTAAARYRVRLPAPGADRIGEIWAVPHGERVVLVASTFDDGEAGQLGQAHARVMMALLRFEDLSG